MFLRRLHPLRRNHRDSPRHFDFAPSQATHSTRMSDGRNNQLKAQLSKLPNPIILLCLIDHRCGFRVLESFVTTFRA